jgi:hypothetical protein
MKIRIIHTALVIFAASALFGGAPTPNTMRLQAVVREDSPNARELKLTVLRYSPDQRSIVVRFENKSHRPLKLLRPLDGSEWGWHLPFYDVSLTDSAGKTVPLTARCGVSGLYSDIKWPDDYRIQILPGDAYETHVHTAREDGITGKFNVRLRYTYDGAVAAANKGVGIQYPADLWSGSTASEPVEIVIPEPK